MAQVAFLIGHVTIWALLKAFFSLEKEGICGTNRTVEVCGIKTSGTIRVAFYSINLIFNLYIDRNCFIKHNQLHMSKKVEFHLQILLCYKPNNL